MRAFAERHPWWFTAASFVLWTVGWPFLIIWLLVRRARKPRVERLLDWYPAAWRERYGDEFAELLRESIAGGRGGLRLSLDVMREGIAARFDESPATRPLVCLTLCWVPLIPQGIVPMIFLLTSAPTRSWFLALYVPEPFQWATAAAMFTLGLTMLTIGLADVRRARSSSSTVTDYTGS
jgi:hypothetical protein